MIAIVDYGMGNLRSVEKGFLKAGFDARIVRTAAEIEGAPAVVLPGVGAFRDCMLHLHERNLTEAIMGAIRAGKPYLGICLGLQVLFSQSEEFGRTPGLDVFAGKVLKFPEGSLKVPHMGWNNINIKSRPPLFEGLQGGEYFYFVHSYYVKPDDEGIIAATTEYGVEFTSAIWRDNVMAVQFHPEKSQTLGLGLLKNFGEFAAKEA